MNVTTGKTKDDTPLYRVKDFQPSAVSEWLYDLPDEKCRVDLDGVGYLKFATERERKCWADGYGCGRGSSSHASEALLMLFHYISADAEDRAYLDEQFAEQLEALPPEIGPAMKAAISRLASSPSSAPRPESSATGRSA